MVDARISLAVHAGAWNIPEDEANDHREALAAGLEAGWPLLDDGASALDACVAAVAAMEDAPVVNAGTGAVLDALGAPSLDAGVMEGSRLRAGAVAAVTRVRNPVRLARLLLGGPHVMLVGAGAEQHAERHAPELICEPTELITERERERLASLGDDFEITRAFTDHRDALDQPGDTVGAVARDSAGHVAVATSTGGTVNKAPGRVGDSPVIGAGLYADDRLGACAATGWGESLLRVCMAHGACGLLAPKATARRVTARRVTAQHAAEQAVANLAQRVAGLGGCIVVDVHGTVGAAFNTERMAFGWRCERDGKLEEQLTIASRNDPGAKRT